MGQVNVTPTTLAVLTHQEAMAAALDCMLSVAPIVNTAVPRALLVILLQERARKSVLYALTIVHAPWVPHAA